MALTSDISEGIRDRAYNKIVYWILLAGLVGLGAVILYDYGYLGYLYAADTSGICILITVLFVAFSAYCLSVIISFSHELRVATFVSQALSRNEAVTIEGEAVRVGGRLLPATRLVTEHVLDLLLKRARDAEAEPGVLLDSFISQLRSRTRFGVYASDVLYKLGMLGTVIGFIQMLGTIGGMGEFTTEALRDSLQSMTGGMGTALLTTIAGLVCGLILRVEFNLADSVAADVVKKTVRIGDIYLAPFKRTPRDV